MINFLRIIKFAFQDIGRNFTLSFTTILILVLMLLSINTLVIVHALTTEAVTQIENQIDVSVYFEPGVEEDQVKEIQDYIQSFPEVVSITYIAKEDVLSAFREQHKEDTGILASLDELEANPLGPTLIVQTRSPEDHEKVIEALSIPEYDRVIEAETFGDIQKAIERISTITEKVRQFVLVLSILFGIIAFLVIFNTVRVAIYTHRIEIGIKKLVGATNWFVRGPYIIEAIFFTLVSVAATGTILFFVVGFLDRFITTIFGTVSFLTNYFSSHIVWLTGAQLGMVFLLTMITSLLAMRRYLRV